MKPVRLRIIFINVKVSAPCCEAILLEVLHMSSITLLEARRIRATGHYCRKADGRYIAHFDVARRNGDHVVFFHNM